MAGDEASQPLLVDYPHSNGRASENAAGTEGGEGDQEGGDPDHPFFSKRHYRYHQQGVQRFLASRTQHWCVLSLVTLDLLGIFVDIFINLYTCEEGTPSPAWDSVRNGLNIAGLVFSCLFMLELLLSVWAFGFKYFQSYFHSFDAFVIVAGFIVDVLLHGVLEEVASLVVVLRLWRFFKIIEEFTVGAQEQMDGLQERINGLEVENLELKKQIVLAKAKKGDEESGAATTTFPSAK